MDNLLLSFFPSYVSKPALLPFSLIYCSIFTLLSYISKLYVPAPDTSQFQRNPTVYGMTLCVLEIPQEKGGHDPRRVAAL